MRCSTLGLYPGIASQVSYFVCAFLSTCLCFCLSVYPSVCPTNPEYGLVRLVGRSHHPAGVSGGEEGSGLLRSQGAAADEGQQQPERGAPAAPEGGRDERNGQRQIRQIRSEGQHMQDLTAEKQRKQKVGVEIIFYLFFILFNNSGEQQGAGKRGGVIQERSANRIVS